MSIDSLYENVIAKLTKSGKVVEISKQLLSQTNNADRVLFVYDIINELELFPMIKQVTKSKNVSPYYRNLGNHCFQNSEFYQAWQYYNLALLHAPTTRDEMAAFALSNRSATFFSLKKYRESLNDVNKVLSMKYPGKLKDKLLKRKADCEKALDEYKNDVVDASDILKMTHEKDPRFLCASSKLQVVCNDEMGRHVVAKEDIKVGEILVQEEPYLVLLQKTQYLFSCSYCLSRDLNLLACDKCCFSMYCSESCKEKAWKEYHEHECPLMATLVHMEFTKLELLALKIVLKARSDHNSWSSLFKTIEEAEANAGTEYRGHVKLNGEWVYDSKYYPSIHTLASNIEKRSVSDIFQKSVTAAVFLYLLELSTDFFKMANEDERGKMRKCVAGTTLLHVMTSPTNMHGISANLETSDGNYVDEMNIASAPYAFLSLLNHSCCPNVVRVNKLGTGLTYLFALRPIKKGMQLFDNYGSHHALEDRASRQASLKFQYKFLCQCEACVDNWPTYLRLKRGSLPGKLRAKKQKLLHPGNIEQLQKGNRKTALELFKPLCELAEALEPYTPCMEVADCQESLKQCLVIFEQLLEYGYSQTVEWKAIPPSV